MRDHPLFDPEVGVKRALMCLPPAFRDVSTGWQITSGAGLDPDHFRLRTWHWLDSPLTGDELKFWFKPAIERQLVDPVTLVESQPHYLSITIEGVEDDPCPQRFGILRLAKAAVPVPDMQGIMRRHAERERAEREASRRRSEPRSTEEIVEGVKQRIKACCDKIKAASEGARHPTYLEEAGRAKALCDKYGLSWENAKRDLEEAYLSTLDAKKRANASAAAPRACSCGSTEGAADGRLGARPARGGAGARA
jgi:hypothetical protein